MKHIIIEGGDRLGKSTLIKNICKFYNYDNIHIRHFGKPPKVFPENVSPFEFQKICFWKEFRLLEELDRMERDEPYNYYENIVIWNRAHIGEYVYGQMFRKVDPKSIEKFFLSFEEGIQFATLILLTADNVDFFIDKEDGESLSITHDEKRKELKLFDEAFDLSLIHQKKRIVVNDGMLFKPHQVIFNEVIETINQNIYGPNL